MGQLSDVFKVISDPDHKALRDAADKFEPKYQEIFHDWLTEIERQKDQREAYLRETEAERVMRTANGDFRQQTLKLGPGSQPERITEEQVKAHIEKYPELDGELAAKDREDRTSSKIWEARFKNDRWETEQAEEYHQQFVQDLRAKVDELTHDQSLEKAPEKLSDYFNKR